MRGMTFEAVNWNTIQDSLDKEIWDKLKGQVWYPSEFAVSNDASTWSKLTDSERWLFMRVTAGLTLLDTLQAEFGAPALMVDAKTKHEKAVYWVIGFMEEIHAESYSFVFQTLASHDEIEKAFRWAAENEHLQNKASIINQYYQGNDPFKKKIASVFLESFLFYSGFYYPLYLNGHQRKLTNTADIIRTIMKDEAVHGLYIGEKFKQAFAQLPHTEQEVYKDWAYELLDKLYLNEVQYTQDLYEDQGLVEEVKKFLRYNSRKALNNLGFSELFPYEEIDPVIENQLDVKGVTKDIFSGKSNYSKVDRKEVTDDDFADFDDF